MNFSFEHKDTSVQKYIIPLILGLFISLYFRLTVLESLSLTYFFLYFSYFITKLSQKFIIFELAQLIAIVSWLIGPLPFYHFFTEKNEWAIKWVKFMPVDSNEYYSFVLPATIALMFGFHYKTKYDYVLSNTGKYFDIIQIELNKKRVLGPLFLSIGILGGLLTPYVPTSLSFVFYLIQKLTYVGLLYIYFIKIPFKNIILFSGVGMLVFHSIKEGMFGDLIHIVLLVGSLLISSLHLSFIKKLGIILAGIYLIFLLQSIKHQYRAIAWNQGYSINYFFSLVGKRILNPFEALGEESTLLYLARVNQGYLIAKTMYHVPKDKPFANGETIIKSVAASIVPRFLWTDKPESGGKYNLLRFWGYKLTRYSMNLGSIGEAYGNFNKFGAVIFMFFYGLTYKLILNYILKLTTLSPTWLIWMPFVFLYSIAAETDIVTTTNWLIKSFLFVVLVRFLFKIIFRVKI
jgi:hypothetical protein